MLLLCSGSWMSKFLYFLCSPWPQCNVHWLQLWLIVLIWTSLTEYWRRQFKEWPSNPRLPGKMLLKLCICVCGVGRHSNDSQPRLGSEHVAVSTIQFEVWLRWCRNRLSSTEFSSCPVLEQWWNTVAVLAGTSPCGHNWVNSALRHCWFTNSHYMPLMPTTTIVLFFKRLTLL